MEAVCNRTILDMGSMRPEGAKGAGGAGRSWEALGKHLPTAAVTDAHAVFAGLIETHAHLPTPVLFFCG